MTEARSLMTKEIIKIKPEMPIQDAFNKMKKHGIRHLPVVDQDGKLVGMLSDRDVQRAVNVKIINRAEQEKSFNPNDTVEHFMSQPVQTVNEDTSIENLTKLMVDLKVSAFVVNGSNDNIKGIITTEDLLKFLLELLHTSDTDRKKSIGELYWGHV